MTRHPNRIRSQVSTKAKFWCSRCDAQLVGEVGKCKRCGGKEARRKVKGGSRSEPAF